MNERHENTDDPERALGLALEDLAATIPNEPTSLEAIYSRAGRFKRRRRLTRLAAGTGVAALTLAGIAVLRNAAVTEVNTPASTPSGAAVPTTVTTAAPKPCSGMSAEEVQRDTNATSSAVEQKKAAAAHDTSQADSQKKAAAARASRATSDTNESAPSSAADRQKQAVAAAPTPSSVVKLAGYVVGAPTGDTFKVKSVDLSGPTKELEITMSSATTFLANDHPVARPTLSTGQLVGVSAHAEGSAYVADIIDTQPGTPRTPVRAQDALRGKGLAKVVAKHGSVLTLQPVDPGLDATTLTVDLNAVHPHHSNGTTCSRVDLAVGQGVGIMVVRASQQSPWKVSDLIFP